MDDNNLKQGISELLRRHDFAVTDIEREKGKRTPDLHIRKAGADYIIEIKARGDDEDALQQEDVVLDSGGIASRSGTINRTNTVSGIVGDAADQLKQHAGPPGAFNIVWLHAEGRDAELQFMQFRGSIYGLRDILDMSGGKDNRECYYFDFSDFFRHKTALDGAILTTESQLQVCVNDLSPNADRFRRSPLIEAFKGGIHDPLVLEQRGDAYIADCDYDRREAAKVITYLQEKYKKQRLIDIDLKKHTATTRVPHDPK